MRRNPYCVILFDEIEKAHPDVFNILLQLLDDGRLTDSQGRTVDFKNAIVIMTSNLGSQFLKERGRLDDEDLSRRMAEALRAFFRPEFLNRIDEIIVFRFLGRGEILRIVDLQVEAINERLAERGLSLELTAAARDAFVERGYSPDFGARPLKRLMQKLLLDPLARLVIEGTVSEGDVVAADWRESGIVLDAAKRKERERRETAGTGRKRPRAGG